MASLIDPVILIEHPKNIPMFVECRGHNEFRFRVAWKYDEELHSVIPIGGKFRYDIDEYNRKWRAWNELPTAMDLEATPWIQEDTQ